MSTDAYKREHYRELKLRMLKNYFSDIFDPAVKASGESMAVYIKKAIEMRMKADGFVPPKKP